jgi:hypothetical protein
MQDEDTTMLEESGGSSGTRIMRHISSVEWELLERE